MRRGSKAEDRLKARIARLEQAYRTYCRVMTGVEEPLPVVLVMASEDWRPKVRALLAAGDRIEFDLLELASIISSARRADWQPASESLSNPVNQAASYLRAVKSSLLPAFLDPQGRGVIAEAADRGDSEFFIGLGKRLMELGRMTPDDIQMDSLKSWLVWSWAPGYIKPAFWPGLAYMAKQARLDAWLALGAKKGVYSRSTIPVNTFGRICERLGLKAAKTPFIRFLRVKDGSMTFA